MMVVSQEFQEEDPNVSQMMSLHHEPQYVSVGDAIDYLDSLSDEIEEDEDWE